MHKKDYLLENSAFPAALCILLPSPAFLHSSEWCSLTCRIKIPEADRRMCNVPAPTYTPFWERDPNSSLQVTKGGGETW